MLGLPLNIWERIMPVHVVSAYNTGLPAPLYSLKLSLISRNVAKQGYVALRRSITLTTVQREPSRAAIYNKSMQIFLSTC